MEVKTTRFSGADWATELKDIMLVGVGGIGSWTALNLARIGHNLILIDPDVVDQTNVHGGQMFNLGNVNGSKVTAVANTCKQMGGTSRIETMPLPFTMDLGALEITITGLDNMAARKEVFNAWKEMVEAGDLRPEESLLIDGRLTMEMYEVFAIRGNDTEAIKKYEEKALFDDSETKDLDCTTKQTTFGAMGIAGAITSTLSNFLTNRKLGMEMRDVPFYERNYYPMKMVTIKTAEQYGKEEAEATVELDTKTITT